MKNKGKKLISVLLSILMIMSVMTGAFSVLAADKTEAVTALEEKVNAFGGKLNVAEPTEADLSGYNEITAAFKALSADEKESMDVFAFDKVYHLVLDREYQVAKKNDPSLKTAQLYINASKSIPDVLGGVPEYVSEATQLGIIVTNSKTTAEDMVNAFAAASVNARLLSACYYSSYECFYYALSSNPARSFSKVVTTVYNALIKANPNPEKKPSTKSNPKPANYPEGVNDPQYKADYAEYVESYHVQRIWTVNDYNYKGGYQIEALNEVAKVASEYQSVVDAVVLARDGKMDFDTTGAQDKAAQAVEAYNALSDFEKS